MRIAILLAAVAQAAASPPGNTLLWNNVHAGISKADFKALWPKRTTPLGDGCFADVGAEFSRGRLETVTLEWSAKDTSKRCGDVVSRSLHSKYGEPVALASDVEVGDCGNSYAGGLAGALAGLCEGLGGEDPKTSKYYRWVADGVEITLKRSADNEWQWSIKYRPALQPSKAVENKL
jgi:hypothetical protein